MRGRKDGGEKGRKKGEREEGMEEKREGGKKRVGKKRQRTEGGWEREVFLCPSLLLGSEENIPSISLRDTNLVSFAM